MPNEVEIIVRARDLASKTIEGVGLKAEETGAKFGTLGKMAGTGLAVIGVAAVAVAAEGVKMASRFQSTMEQLATQAHVPQKSVDQLSQSVLGLAGKVGSDPDSLAEALYHIESSFASTGITGEKAMHLLQTSAEGAKLGHADLVDVTNALDAAVVSGIPGVKNLDQAMGMLNATVGAGDMHMQDLAAAFGTGAVAVVKGYGLSLRDVGAALATFGDNNIRGAKAGTQLRMTVQSLAVPAKGGAKALEELGLKSDTLAKDMQSGGLIKAVTDLHDRLEKTGNGGKKSGEILTEAFGKKAGVGLQMLVDQFDRLKSKYKEIDKGAKDFGADWALQQQTFAQAWDQVKAAVEAAMIQLGLKLLPLLSKILPAAGQVAVSVINALTTAIGWVSDHLKGANPFFDTFLGIVKAVANWVKTELIPAIKQAAENVLPHIRDMVKSVTKTFQDHKDVIKQVGEVLSALGLFITEIVVPALGVLIGVIIDQVGPAFEGIMTVIHYVVIPAIKLLLRAWLIVVGGIIDTAATLFGWVPKIGPKLRQAAKAFDKFRDDVNNALDGINTSVNVTVRVSTATINGQAVTIRDSGEGVGVSISSRNGGSVQTVRARASGGIIGAAGGGPRSGQTLVGENGPELVDIPPGSTVHSNPDTERMLGGGQGGGPMTIILQIGSTTLGEVMVDPLRKAIRTRGGNVQAVLGR